MMNEILTIELSNARHSLMHEVDKNKGKISFDKLRRFRESRQNCRGVGISTAFDDKEIASFTKDYQLINLDEDTYSEN